MVQEDVAFDLSAFISNSNALIKELRKESDRGAALVGVEYLHQLIKELVRAHMIDDDKHVKKLLKYPSALGTAAAQIDLAFALGWIGSQLYSDLALAREVRNKFAHTSMSVTFDDTEIREKCGKFKALTFSRPYRMRKPKDQFLYAILMLMLQLAELRQNTQRSAHGVDPPVRRFVKPIPRADSPAI